MDKVNQSERKKNVENILTHFGAANLHHVLYSVPKNRGRKELLAMIREAIRDESE